LGVRVKVKVVTVAKVMVGVGEVMVGLRFEDDALRMIWVW